MERRLQKVALILLMVALGLGVYNFAVRGHRSLIDVLTLACVFAQSLRPKEKAPPVSAGLACRCGDEKGEGLYALILSLTGSRST
jgi:hypothetical protein